MSPAAHLLVPDGRRSLARLVAAAAVAVVASLGLATGVAAADEGSGTTVVGQLVQAWPEEGHGHEADHGADGSEVDEPLSWVETAEGESVRVPTEDVEHLPAGATVAVTLGAQELDEATGSSDEEVEREVLESDVLAPPPSTSAPGPTGTHTNEVTVVLVAPGGVPAPTGGMTAQQLVDVVAGPVAAFWSKQSDGAIMIGATAARADWVEVDAGCADPGALWDQATRAAREASGYSPGPREHLLVYLPPRSRDCAYALAEVGAGVSSGGRMYVTSDSASVIAHELGHNFGLGHSSGLQCDGTIDTGTCRTEGYRDYYDVMGASWGQLGALNAVQEAQLGVLGGVAQKHLTVGSPATTVTLAPLAGRSGIRALRLTDAEGVDHWLEYRSAVGHDAWLGTAANGYGLDSGVLLRRSGTWPDTSLLLDGSPGATSGWDEDWKVALPENVPLALSGGDFTVTVQSISPTGAVVHVVPEVPRTGSAVPAPAVEAPPGELLPGDGDGDGDGAGGSAGRPGAAATPSPAAPSPAAPSPAGTPEGAPEGEPTATRFWAPPYGGTPAAARTTPELQAAAESTTLGALVVPAAGCTLVGGVLLGIAWLRRAAVRR